MKTIQNEEFTQLFSSQVNSSVSQSIKHYAKALQVGDWAPDFLLSNSQGEIISTEEWRKRTPLVITFYRGGLFPYCNGQLKALQKQLFQIQGLGGKLIALSPESPDNSLRTIHSLALGFEVLSDRGNQIARRFGIVSKVPSYLREVYNGYELPLPATFVVGQNGRITYAFTEENFTQRAPIRDILAALYELRGASSESSSLYLNKK